jgi:hypothetical protein
MRPRPDAAGPGHVDRALGQFAPSAPMPDHSTDPDRHGPGEPMTKAERSELQRVVRLQARTARARVDALKAARLEELEAELSALYPPEDPRWAEVTAAAEVAVRAADAAVAAACRDAGVREEFRPSLALRWFDRGSNADAKRRAELRKAGAAAVERSAREARAAIQEWETAAATDLVARGLTTTAAAAWLDALPLADALVPPVTAASLEAGEEVPT